MAFGKKSPLRAFGDGSRIQSSTRKCTREQNIRHVDGVCRIAVPAFADAMLQYLVVGVHNETHLPRDDVILKLRATEGLQQLGHTVFHSVWVEHHWTVV